MERQPPGSVARVTLLNAAIDFAAVHGLSDVSLREMATAVGTSHRMLIYHFGSKEGLLVEIVKEVERRQRERMSKLETNSTLSGVEQVRRMWRDLSDPAMWPLERLFFEVYGHALQGQPHATHFLDGVVDDWLGPATEQAVKLGMSHRDARATARLGLAVMRGLLLDLLATGDQKGCREALERFIAGLRLELMEAERPERATRQLRSSH
jgi:AcrR family transcriptional regulator